MALDNAGLHAGLVIRDEGGAGAAEEAFTGSGRRLRRDVKLGPAGPPAAVAPGPLVPRDVAAHAEDGTPRVGGVLLGLDAPGIARIVPGGLWRVFQ